jgi:hypothetical protein
MMEKKLLPGSRVSIIGGKYNGQQGILRYETEMCYLVLIHGMMLPRYLLKENVVESTVTAADVKVDATADK